MRIIPFTIYVGRVRIVKEYFFFEKYSIKRIVKGYWYKPQITNFVINVKKNYKLVKLLSSFNFYEMFFFQKKKKKYFTK